jgi:hypothetical protein
VEAASQRHGVDHQPPIVGELEQDDLKQIAGAVGGDREYLGRIGIGVEIEPSEGMIDRVAQIVFGHPCLKAERWISTP